MEQGATQFSDAQIDALEQCARGILVTQPPEKTETDVIGVKTAGVAVYKKLIKAGLIFATEEDDSEFDWTPMYQLTEEGERALALARAASG